MAGPDASESAEASAEAYGRTIREHGQKAWDVVLFGVGPDGHVASLFPHHPAQRLTDAIAVAVHDSPKPPPDRVSLTFECFERSHEVWFLVSGADKAEAVGAALAPGRRPLGRARRPVPAGSDATLWLRRRRRGVGPRLTDRTAGSAAATARRTARRHDEGPGRISRALRRRSPSRATRQVTG